MREIFAMYLENSEQNKVSGEGDLSADVILAEQCSVPKGIEGVGLGGNAKVGLKQLVGYTEQTVSGEMDPALLCVEHGNLDTEETETCTCYDGNAGSFEQHATSDGFSESDQTFQDCETEGLSRPFDKCAQHCECFKPCKSSEHGANHSLGSESSPCCGHCPKHLRLFQQCEPSDQQSESSDFVPDELEVNSDCLGQYGTSYFLPDCTDHLELLQQYKPSDQLPESFDSEQDGATEESEQSFTHNLSDSVDSLDGAAEFCEYEEAQAQSDDEVDEDVESYEPELNEMELSDEEDMPAQVGFDDDDPFPSDSEETQADMEENSQTSTSDMPTNGSEQCENDNSEYEANEECNSDNTDEYCAEEDGSSECSSVETKSFKTCLDDSFPSDPCSDSSEESEKGTQEDSSDEQMQWESFEEEDEEAKLSNDNRSKEEKKKTPTIDVVIEDYFDLFDRVDTCGHMFVQKQRYISCFDGGDIHDRLYLEEESHRRNTKTIYKLGDKEEEVTAEETKDCPKDAPIDAPEDDLEDAPEDSPEDDLEDDLEDSEEEDLSQRNSSCMSENQSEDWTVKSESGSTEGEAEENELEAFPTYDENSEEAEDDYNAYSDDEHASDDWGEESEVCLYSADEDGMLAPYASQILYEDEASSNQSDESLSDADEIEKIKEDVGFLACSEMEPYWALIDDEESGEVYEAGVEEYYAYQIKSIQSSETETLTGFMLEERLNYHQVNREGSRRESKYTLSQDAEVFPEETESVRFGPADGSDVEETPQGQHAESDNECELKDASKEKIPPVDIIHSVVQKHEATQSRDSEEEQSDDESCERCDCEYCIPPAEQVPVESLLPQMKTNDEGKICVVIDLDETLVHSSFKPVNNADYIIPVEMEGTLHQVYVLKRPHVDEFLKRMGELFECVLFTASLSKYADPVSDLLDKWGAFTSRLFREACVFHKGNYVKDLSRLGRDLNKVIIIDNSPASYIFHPENAVPVASWFNDTSDTELLDLIPFFERLSKVDDIYNILKEHRTPR